MNQLVKVELLVPAEVAERLKDAAGREEAVRLLASWTHGKDDPLERFLMALPRDPTLPELSMEEIVAEVKAHRAERRS